jgi:hypothetical protein
MNIITEYLYNTNNIAICIFPADGFNHHALKQKMVSYTLFFALRFKSFTDNLDIVFADSIDDGLTKYKDYNHILFMAAGVRIYDSSILLDINDVINNNPNYMTAAHILEWGNDWYELHHQFVLVNVKNWIAAGAPQYGGWTPDVDVLPVIERSKENFHDDYTPLWIKPTGEHMWIYHEKQGWNFIGQAFNNGFDIVNWDQKIRSKRTYYYPETNSELFYECLIARSHSPEITNPNQRKLINEVIGMKNQVWILNSEDMDILSNGETYDAIALPASGFKYLDIYKARALRPNGRIIIYDYNQTSIDWIESIYRSPSTDLRHIVAAFPKHSELKWYGINNPPVLTPKGALCKEFVRDFEKTVEYFGGNESFLDYLEQFRSTPVEFIKTDLLNGYNNLITALGSGDSMLHISNIFATDYLNAAIGLTEMEESFKNLKSAVNNRTRIIGLTPHNEYVS